MEERLLTRREASEMLALSPAEFDRVRKVQQAKGHPFTVVETTGAHKGRRFLFSEMQRFIREHCHPDACSA